MVRSILTAFALSITLAGLAAPAFADVAPPDPCDGLKEEEDCKMTNGDPGVCTKDKAGGLECDVAPSSDTNSGCALDGRAPQAGGWVLLAAAAALTAARRRSRRA
jgi:hypothetical protein